MNENNESGIHYLIPAALQHKFIISVPSTQVSLPVAEMQQMRLWDPTKQRNDPPILDSALNRIKKDLMSIYKDPAPGIHVTANESDIRNIHALIVGPSGTPYEGGMFYFFLRCPYNFPIKPPKVKLMTTDAGKVRFNPNFYSSGKVCLSTIGTWTGPGWTPAQQIESLLVSIQSLMNEDPIKNEPGSHGSSRINIAEEYKKMVAHETIRVAVIGMVENECHLSIPPEFVPVIEDTFLKHFESYILTCKHYMGTDGKEIVDPLNPSRKIKFDFKGMSEKLDELQKKLLAKRGPVTEPMSDIEGSDYETDDDEEDKIDENNVHDFICSSSGTSEEDTGDLTKEDIHYSEEDTD